MRRALAFLTVAGAGATPDGRTMRWFPLAGALVGLVVGGSWWLAAEAFPPLLAGAIVVAVDLAVTGLLHVDGLADSADGLLPHLPRERRLEVMADPTAGAFAVAAVAGVLVLRAAALGSRPVDVGLIVGIWCASRSTMALVALTRPYARPGGLASSFLGDRLAPGLAAAGIVAGAALATATDGRAGLAAVVALLVGAALVVALAQRRLGGFTGDVLGALGVVGETLALVVAAAKW
ncbi:adenosylcobinamide-GDP ribazoletransferase [Aquihabitans sp. G128]|uniref:adenosylcobinamide-GDP ribazoletransferase n=1 Tax=Aquihabitans sp. G128 TaxID=2849779 RepID=UPI001C23CB81|nr:adenosylcobinamide-GDP ribazoletransferase [Aquihabitans sp. G128]QXC59197.1 adenosylcobinamide-GDP ribazoletransferase [Aquihabitans sp. G128]